MIDAMLTSPSVSGRVVPAGRNAVIGAAGAMYIVPLYAALQDRAETKSCSRVLAALNVMNALFMVASAGFTLLLFGRGISIPQVFGIVGAMNVAAMACGMVALPEFRQRLARLFVRR